MKPLRSNKPLKSKSPLKANAKPKKQTLPTITRLRKKADTLFAHYIRLRDAEIVGGLEWQSECISCDRVNVVRYWNEDDAKWHWGRKEEIGHFVSRGNYFLRYDEVNCNGQCVYCNKYLSGNQAGYSKGLDDKYGLGTAQGLIEAGNANKTFRLNRAQLEQVIQASNEYLNWVYEQERELL